MELNMTANCVDLDMFYDSSSHTLDSLSGSSSGSSDGSGGSFFECLDREDRRRGKRQEASAPLGSEMEKERKSVWMETCDQHRGEWVDITTRLPDPCPQCKQADGHGQKARVFCLPEEQVQSFDTQFSKQQHMTKSSLKFKKLIPFRN